MARARGRLHKSTDVATTGRSMRHRKVSQGNSDVPDVFQDMLHDDHASATAGAYEYDQPLKKKRKTIQSQGSSSTVTFPASDHTTAESVLHAKAKVQAQMQTKVQDVSPPENAHSSSRVLQTIIDSDESEDSDESDLEWEDALGDDNDEDDQNETKDAEPEIGDISITIGENESQEKTSKKKTRRRAITSIDKKRRLDVHKVHVLCLLYHVHRRNTWCNDERVQATLRRLPSPQTLSNLVPNPEFPQYQASKRFIDGMNDLKLLWSKRFKVTAEGMYQPRWADADADVRPFSDFDELDDPMDKDDFRKAAHTLQGSQDLGAQLFCALLRGIGIEARLVCSLQCLPFASAAQPSTPSKPSVQKNTIHLDPYNKQSTSSPSKPKSASTPRPKRLSRLERVFGERHPVLNKAGVAPKQKKTYHTPYPVYWVETFNSVHQKWVPIDPMSTFTVNSPEKLEPPLSFAQNKLVYAVAFEEDLVAKDVTRRYAKAYNAKTRKFRVECTPKGERWWKGALKIFKRSRLLDRDQVEDAALARKEASEGIPKNVQDFKDHPVYVLERHLKHNEVIYPMQQVGKVNVGTSMNPKMEPIYRRRDVHIVRSADKWYRLGQDVKSGEQPLKHAKPKKGRRLSLGPDMELDEQQEEEVGAGLYAPFQTEQYVPPPVIRGRVPRNAYGNLDLYVPSMCPKGGTHVRHKLASRAARLIGVDYADAVTGFSFKGRHGTAIIQGVVVAQEYAEAVEAVIDALEYEQEAAAYSQRSAEALRMWRRFYLGLRIAQRVNAIEIDGERGPDVNVQEAIEREDRELAEKEFAGGFFPDEGETAQPPQSRYDPPPNVEEYGGGFIAEDNDFEVGGFIQEDGCEATGSILERHNSLGSSILAEQRLRPRRRRSFNRPIIADDDEDDEYAGGFMPGSSPVAPGPSTRSQHLDRGFEQTDGAADNDGGGFIPEKAEAVKHIAEFHPVQAKEDQMAIDQSLPQPIDNDQTIETAQTQPHKDILMGESDKSSVIVANNTPPPASSPSETGSLLLEDPEDEDADPDWLVDAT